MPTASLIELAKSGLHAARAGLRRARFLLTRSDAGQPCCSFRCNICGRHCRAPLAEVRKREAPSCYHCGSNRRSRTLLAALSGELFGAAVPAPDFRPSRDIIGIGLSDSRVYAGVLARKFAYTNTWFHKPPRLDITAPAASLRGTADFVIASEVLEHVVPPVERAFTGLFELLKPGGVCIFSVPYTVQGETREHFPELHQFTIERTAGKRVLRNRTRDGREQVFDQLRFHGGRGSTLEMRVFAKQSLLRQIAGAGFTQVRIHDYSIPALGIIVKPDTPSLVISMRRPPGAETTGK